jgi:hypothetical protein
MPNASHVSAFGARQRLIVSAIVLSVALLPGCYDSVSTPVVLDIEFVETSVNNTLFAPVVVYRNDVPLDTLSARSSDTYPVGAHGVFTHGWRILRPRGPSGDTIGLPVSGSFGVQIEPRGAYAVTAEGSRGRMFFAPMVDNRSSDSIEVHVRNNPRASIRATFVLPPQRMLNRAHLPYYEWSDSVSVWLVNPARRDTVRFHAADTGAGRLRIDSLSSSLGSGATVDLIYRIR